ncbi:hypothetical protein BgAZ_403210 [Babesia gibsoni]|uniref:Uncharacterized protein n=1 Tax=Babesia gibsoni TaxID=33632 RepID=A0AAD8PDK8_BABGI|nr:hypothetical protein BgAZ_403210 [Babesia gibsoni]
MSDGMSLGVRNSPSDGFLTDRMILRRGAAVHAMVSLAERNSLAMSLKRYAFSCLKGQASDDNTSSAVESDPGSLRFSQGQLRLLRQEQLLLMAENERLVHELHEIRRARTSNAFRPTKPVSVPEFRESKLSKAIDFTLSGERDIRLNAARVSLLCGIISRLRLRVLGCVMRTLSRQPIKSLAYGGLRAFTPGQPNIRQTTVACFIMETIIRSKVDRVKHMVIAALRDATLEAELGIAQQQRPEARKAGSVDPKGLYMPGPHASYQRQLPSFRRYM